MYCMRCYNDVLLEVETNAEIHQSENFDSNSQIPIAAAAGSLKQQIDGCGHAKVEPI